jgi:hypothetical protein
VRGLWLPNFGDGRNDLPGHANPFAGLVPRHVVANHPEQRRQRFGSATGARRLGASGLLYRWRSPIQGRAAHIAGC